MDTEIDEYFLLDDNYISSQWYQPGSQDPGPPLCMLFDDSAHHATPHIDFKLVTNLVYPDGYGKDVPVVYEGSRIYGLRHTIRLADLSRIAIQDSDIKILDQPNYYKIPKTPLDYRN